MIVVALVYPSPLVPARSREGGLLLVGSHVLKRQPFAQRFLVFLVRDEVPVSPFLVIKVQGGLCLLLLVQAGEQFVGACSHPNPGRLLRRIDRRLVNRQRHYPINLHHADQNRDDEGG
jgi:hypothetical protein